MAMALFIKNIKSISDENYLLITMLVCLAFNFILHIGYGTEPFLYSTDWTYALILFAAIGLQEYSEKNWLKYTLMTLIVFVFVNNMWVLYLIAKQVSQFLV